MPRRPMTPEERRQAQKAAKQRYYEGNKEAAIARATLYNQTHPQERKQTVAKYYAAHSDEISEYRAQRKPQHHLYTQQYYLENHEDIKAKVAAYRAANPEQVRLSQQKTNARPERKEDLKARTAHRRAQKAASPLNNFTAKEWREMQEHYNHRCVYCGKRAKGKLTQDHITPLSKGGSHTKSNIVPACKSCNSRKHTNAPPVPVQPLLL